MTACPFAAIRNAIESFGEYSAKQDELNRALSPFESAILNFAVSCFQVRMEKGATVSPLAFRGAAFESIVLHSPQWAKETAGNIAYFQNAEKRGRETPIRTSARPGKALRKIIPFLTDQETATLVDMLRADFPIESVRVEILESDRKAFRAAYLGDNYAPMMNPRLSGIRKSLSNSCMRYRFDGNVAHPAETYASPDFRLLVARDQENRVAARCLLNVRKSPPQYAPIYGATDSAIDAILAELESMGAVAPDDNWTGARLLRIEESDSCFVAPYLDVSPRQLTDSGNGYLTISRYGELSGSETGGLTHDENVRTCDDCGCRMDDDDSFCDDNGNCYCESCYHERFGTCEHCHDTTPRADLESVNVIGYRRRQDSEMWCDHCRANHAVETVCDSELWADSYVTQIQDSPDGDSQFVSELAIENGDWQECAWSGEYHESHNMGETVSGEFVRLELLRAEDSWQLQDSGLWEMIQLELPLTGPAELESAIA